MPAAPRHAHGHRGARGRHRAHPGRELAGHREASGAGLQAVEVEAEAAEEIAETEAGAAVAGAVLEGEIIADGGGGETAPDLGEPIVIEAPAPEAEPEPVTEEPPVVETAPARGKKSGGYWGAYR